MKLVGSLEPVDPMKFIFTEFDGVQTAPDPTNFIKVEEPITSHSSPSGSAQHVPLLQRIGLREPVSNIVVARQMRAISETGKIADPCTRGYVRSENARCL